MKSTNDLKEEKVLLSKEQQALTGYLAIIRDERACLSGISKNIFRRKITRIRARKQVFQLDQEITAKESYLNEIEENIRLLELKKE